MFHSTLRRQLRVVNYLISSKKFQNSLGFALNTMITADIYPLIKCGKLNYDDITIINKISLHDINDDKMIEYKKEAIEELLSSFKSHSTKSSLKQKLFKKSDLSTNNFTQPEKNLIALLALVKIGRDQ